MGGATGAAGHACHAGNARRCVTVRARNPRDPELGPKRTACGGQASARCPDPVARNQRAGMGSAAGCDSPRHRESDARFEEKCPVYGGRVHQFRGQYELEQPCIAGTTNGHTRRLLPGLR